LRFAARRHAGVEPAAWVRMATLDGAEALGLGDQLGSLAVGKRADLLALRCEGDDPLEPVLGSGTPIGVWIGGERTENVD
jgi:5-methylthioadenosine/S-adenosylhomocysteine deaminase